MITLYLKTGCPFCAKVLSVVDVYGIPYTEKNVSDEKNVEELVRLGGKKQEPFMVDGDVMMYESGAITAYLEKKFGNGEAKKPKVHFVGGEVCPS